MASAQPNPSSSISILSQSDSLRAHPKARVRRIVAFGVLFVFASLVGFVLEGDYLLKSFYGTSNAKSNSSSGGREFDQERCFQSILTSTRDFAEGFASLSNSDKKEIEIISHFVAQLAFDPNLKGSMVDVSSGGKKDHLCEEVGKLSLIMAAAQREALRQPSCRKHNEDNGSGNVAKRSIWVINPYDGPCSMEQAKHLFSTYKFLVTDYHEKYTEETEETEDVLTMSIDVPIHFWRGYAPNHSTTAHVTLAGLADAPIHDIALLNIRTTEKNGEDDEYANILHAMFAFYRRVRINGYVAVHGYDTHPLIHKALDEFLVDGNFTLQTDIQKKELIPNGGVGGAAHDADGSDLHWFQKTNHHIRVPPSYRDAQIKPSIDPLVKMAWETLGKWHAETVRKFYGHVGDNPYQTFRYIEAMKHVVERQVGRKLSHMSSVNNASKIDDLSLARVNVCETGFNGGHSAMLFLSFLNRGYPIDLHYYGWDLKQVGSSLPTAQRMSQEYGHNFHIFWGDSKQTLPNADSDMKGQKCHLIVVDKEHSKNGVVNDLKNFLIVAEPGAVVFGDDCAPYKRTVPKSEEMLEGWKEFVSRGELISVANYRNPDLGSPGFVEGIVPKVEGQYTLSI